MGENLEADDRDVLAMVCVGMTDAEIADRLSTTGTAVAARVTELLDRLGLANRAELIRAAVLGRL